MKKPIVFLFLLILSITSFSQQTQFSKEGFLEKSKKQNTAAWVMLGTGIVMASGGVVWGLQDIFSDNVGPSILFFTGVASMAGSIPLFVASGKNKRKAMNMSFKFQNIPQLQHTAKINQPIPSINLKISL